MKAGTIRSQPHPCLMSPMPDTSASTPPQEDPATDGHAAPASPPASATAQAAAPLSPQECAAELKRRFPALFAGAPKPVKLRIHADIQERAPGEFSRQVLSGFLRRHTGATSYLIALTRATQRFDLDGQPAGELSEEHKQVAAEELKRRRALREDRMQAEMDERRNRAGLLRDFERTTLTPTNFAALKGLTVEAMEEVLARARQEATEAPAPRPGHGPQDGRAHGRGGRPDSPRQPR